MTAVPEVGVMLQDIVYKSLLVRETVQRSDETKPSRENVESQVNLSERSLTFKTCDQISPSRLHMVDLSPIPTHCAICSEKSEVLSPRVCDCASSKSATLTMIALQ